MAEFFYMDGYAVYVWSSYGLAAVMLVINLILPWRRRRELLRRLASQQRRSGGRT